MTQEPRSIENQFRVLMMAAREAGLNDLAILDLFRARTGATHGPNQRPLAEAFPSRETLRIAFHEWYWTINRRPLEIGTRTLLNMARAHKSRYGTKDEKAAKYAGWQAWINAAHRADPGLPFKTISADAAAYFGVTTRTIERHVKNPKPRGR